MSKYYAIIEKKTFVLRQKGMIIRTDETSATVKNSQAFTKQALSSNDVEKKNTKIESRK